MYFILNKTIKFHPDINELSIINEQQTSVVLSNPASRLLLTLINNTDDVVSREFLLKNVWEDYGYTPSNNNLYMAISELRKAFSALSSEGRFIVTVPKVGLKLEAAIDILEKNNHSGLKIQESNNLQTLLAGVTSEEESNNNAFKLKNVLPRKTIKIMLLTISLLLMVVILIALTVKYNKSIPVTDSIDDFVFTYGKCDIYSHTVSLGMIENIDAFKTEIIQKLKKYNISCNVNNKDIYFQIKRKWTGSKIHWMDSQNSYFIGSCSYINNSVARKCDTFHETHE